MLPIFVNHGQELTEMIIIIGGAPFVWKAPMLVVSRRKKEKRKREKHVNSSSPSPVDENERGAVSWVLPEKNLTTENNMGCLGGKHNKNNCLGLIGRKHWKNSCRVKLEENTTIK